MLISFYAFGKIREFTKLAPPSIEKLKSDQNENYYLKFSLSNGQFTGKFKKTFDVFEKRFTLAIGFLFRLHKQYGQNDLNFEIG